MKETALETGIRHMEKKLAHWLRLFESEHKATVLTLDTERDESGRIMAVHMLVRPVPAGRDCDA